jgi:hypothetical protein
MAVALRRTHAQFLNDVRGHYGLYKSKKMKAACDTMLDFENAKNTLVLNNTKQNREDLNKAETAMLNAWIVWSTTSEFRSVDSKSNGICKKLGVEMGAIRNIDRESRTTAFVLKGEERFDPKMKKPPRVNVTNKTVPAYMRKRDKGGVVLIDAFGGGDSETANGFHRKYGNQESTVMDNIKMVLQMAKELQMPIFDVVMGTNATWKTLTDDFATKVVNIVKPKQPLFGGPDKYVQDTLLVMKEFELEYMVVMGWDANQCVAAAIFGVEPMEGNFVPGLVDYGWDVVTARNLLGANERDELESKWGWPHIGPPPL